MRNPFIRAGVIPADRLNFIVATRGGSAWLLAGAFYWAAAGACGALASRDVWTRVYLFGGFSVPIAGALIARAQGVVVPRRSALIPLVVIASAITPFCFPLLILIERRDPELLPVAMTMIDGAHLLILMWIQLDYAYFLAAVSKGLVGTIFGFMYLREAPAGVGLASAAVSLLAAWSVSRDARNAFRNYSVGHQS